MATKTIPLEAALPGMALASPVLDAGGSVLLPRGATLDAAVLASLRRREIAEVCVVMSEPPPDQAMRELMRCAVEQRLRHLFRTAGDGPASRSLYQAVLDYRLEKLQ